VAWCGICGSDVTEVRHGPIHIPTRPHPVTGGTAPLILGHEIAGWVETVGSAVTNLSEGALVALNALIPCEICIYCARGDIHLCVALGHLGLNTDGGLAEFVTVPVAMAVVAPPGLASDLVALAEPFAVACRAVRRSGARPTTTAVVVGAGSIGLAVAVVLSAQGSGVVLCDVDEGRIDFGRRMGFEAYETTQLRRQGLQTPVVIECTGNADAVNTAVSMTQSGGTLLLLGVPPSEARLDVADIVEREVVLRGSMSHLPDADMVPALDIIAANADAAARLITDRIALPDAVTLGFDVLDGVQGSTHVKVLVHP
jgi:(R,R)-butanediol dehydrogenase/meso-butanediol dehydrogenase/diacetyl reductase